MQRIGRAGHQVDAPSRGRHLPEVPRRPRGVRRGHAGDARRRGRGDPLPAQSARRRSRSRSSRWSRWTHWDVDELFARVRSAAPFARAEPRRVRRRARHALGALSVRRVRGAAAAHHLGPRRRHRHRTRRRAARGGHQRRHDPRPRPVRRVPRSARAARRARVGELDEEMVFESRVGETLRARRLVVAHRGDHARPRARVAGARASRARCRSGRATRPAARSSSAAPSAR